jgi:hypothetical protein
MAEDGILSRVAKAVEGAQSAFQALYNNHRGVYANDSRDLHALDLSLQALGSIVEILDGANLNEAQIDLFCSILATPVAVPISDEQISLANAMINDLCNIERRLDGVRRNITASGPNSRNPEQLLPLEETVSMKRMVEKYCSIISGASSGHIMCVTSFG